MDSVIKDIPVWWIYARITTADFDEAFVFKYVEMQEEELLDIN